MGRAAGRAQTRRNPKAPAPDSPQGREIGLDDRDIPSGLHHLVQEPAPEVTPAVPATPPYFRGDMEHGVPAGPDDNVVRPQDKPKHHGSQPVRYEHPAPEPDPLPVYLVERRETAGKRREAITRVVTCPAAGGEPARVCSVDRERAELLLFNEAAAGGNVIRVGARQSDLAGTTATAPGDGFAVAPQTWSPRIRTQGELWAVSQAATSTLLSVVITTEVND